MNGARWEREHSASAFYNKLKLSSGLLKYNQAMISSKAIAAKKKCLLKAKEVKQCFLNTNGATVSTSASRKRTKLGSAFCKPTKLSESVPPENARSYMEAKQCLLKANATKHCLLKANGAKQYPLKADEPMTTKCS